MLREILIQAWTALRRNPTRSLLTMTGIMWGVVSVALLFAYGSGFRGQLVRAFDAFGKSAVVVWPGQTSDQAGGEKAGKQVRLEMEDFENIRTEGTLVRYLSLETVRRYDVGYELRRENSAVRGVYPSYGTMRNQVPSQGRWITEEDMLERRRVAFLGAEIKEKLFSGRPALGEEVNIAGMRFTVIGVMDPKLQFSNYFSSDDSSIFIPYSTAGDVWNTRYASVLVFSAITLDFQKEAIAQVRNAIAKRQGFNPNDERALRVMDREEFRPIIDGITIGLQVLLIFVGLLTLGIGGVGVMNIMLVSIDERVREIGLRRALGARKQHVMMQVLAEALVITFAGGMLGLLAAYAIAAAVGDLPLLGAVFNDDSGKGDLRLVISLNTVIVSMVFLAVAGIASGFVPARKASALDPSLALRYE
ncbi:MAG: ABC transporter permease [Bryobacterales bacterium]|nr:ABC transporter permease [Bryobacterales bacterium]